MFSGRVSILSVAACAWLLCTSEAAAAQLCSYLVDPPSDESTTGSPGLLAYTVEDCSDQSSKTEIWIGRAPDIHCDVAADDQGTVCANVSAGPASSTSGWWIGYGTWDGYSKHHRINAYNEYFQLGEIRHTPLYAGEPPQEECEEWEMWNAQTGSCVAYNTPILIPVTRSQAVRLTSAERGVLFDMNADGVPDWTAWTARGSRVAFLAIDRNGNGVIDDGRELFGDHTVPGARNGFAALQAMNMELNGGTRTASLSADDPLFERLLLWEDENHNGISEAHELQPAAVLLSDVGLGYSEHKRRDGHGNLFKWRGWASIRTAPGRNAAMERAEQEARRIDIYDVYFVTRR